MSDEIKQNSLTSDSNNSNETVFSHTDRRNNEDIKYYEPRIFTQCNITNSKQKDFKQASMIKVSGKKAIFVNFDFRYTDMQDCYFHQAEFESCDFTGAKFKRCNFRSAKFRSCKFDYISIDETPIDYKQIVRLLPDKPNVAQEILQALRRNAVTLGEMAEARILTLLEVEQEREHLRRAIRSNGDYYPRKYGKLSDQLVLRYRLAKLYLSAVIWGHGERVHNLIITSVVIIAALSFISTALAVRASPDMTVIEFISTLKQYFIQNSMDFLGVTGKHSIEQTATISWLLGLSRVVLTGMFVAVIFRNLSRR